MKNKIGCVIVTYYPNELNFIEIINSAFREVDCLVAVNNSSIPLKELCKGLESLQIEVIENNENAGIAKALNDGIEYLMSKGCSYFLLLDQDSQVPKNMVSALITAINKLSSRENRVAAIGPAYYNSRLQKNAPFIQFGALSIKKVHACSDMPLVPVDFLITSGSLITLEAIENVGMMEEGSSESA